MADQVSSYGLEIVYEEVLSTDLKQAKKLVKTKDNTYKTKALVLASGTSPKKLSLLANEENFNKKGLYQNAQNDHDSYKDKLVVVVGGSDGACKEAIFLF